VSLIHPGAIRNWLPPLRRPYFQSPSGSVSMRLRASFASMAFTNDSSKIPDLVFGAKELGRADARLSPQLDGQNPKLLRHVAQATRVKLGRQESGPVFRSTGKSASSGSRVR